MRKEIKYPNLEAERARRGITYEDLASELGLSRVTLWSKITSGRFNVDECRHLCELFHKKFEYLFASDSDGAPVNRDQGNTHAQV